MARKRIKVRGLYAGSTSDYGEIVNRHEPILQSKQFVENNNEFGIKQLGNVLYMTKEEFDRHNLFRSLFKFMFIHLPSEMQLEASKRFKKNKKQMFRMLSKKNKALREQGFNTIMA